MHVITAPGTCRAVETFLAEYLLHRHLHHLVETTVKTDRSHVDVTPFHSCATFQNSTLTSQKQLHLHCRPISWVNDNKICDTAAYGILVDFQVPSRDNSICLRNMKSESVLRHWNSADNSIIVQYFVKKLGRNSEICT